MTQYWCPSASSTTVLLQSFGGQNASGLFLYVPWWVSLSSFPSFPSFLSFHSFHFFHSFLSFHVLPFYFTFYFTFRRVFVLCSSSLIGLSGAKTQLLSSTFDLWLHMASLTSSLTSSLSLFTLLFFNFALALHNLHILHFWDFFHFSFFFALLPCLLLLCLSCLLTLRCPFISFILDASFTSSFILPFCRAVVLSFSFCLVFCFAYLVCFSRYISWCMIS